MKKSGNGGERPWTEKDGTENPDFMPPPSQEYQDEHGWKDGNPPRDPNKLELLYGLAALTPRPLHTIVKGVFHGGSVTLVYGPPKSGKSFITTDLFLAIADEIRSDWMDHKIIRHGPVLYIACEGHAGYWKRLAAYKKTQGRFPQNFILAIGRPRLLKVDENGMYFAPDPSAILEALEDAKAHGMDPAGIAIDTVFRSFGAGNVNASPDMNVYLECIAKLTDAGYAVALVHHEIKSGGTPAGSVALLGGADNIIHVWRKEETDEQRFWQVEYAKDDAETKPRAFTLKLVELGRDLEEGEAASSLVVEDGGSAPDATPKRKRGRPAADDSDAAILGELIHRELCNLLADPTEGKDMVLKSGMPLTRAVERSRLRIAVNQAGIMEVPDSKEDQKRVIKSNADRVYKALNRLMKKGKIVLNEQWIGVPRDA
jgi:hypothetical protein